MPKKKTANTAKAESLLVELLTEELPPKWLEHLGNAFAEKILNGLIRHQLKQRVPDHKVFATPRRLAVLVPNVLSKAQDRPDQKKLVPAKIAFDEQGKPSVALLKKLEKERIPLNIASKRFERCTEGGVEFLFVNVTIPGAVLATSLQEILEEAVTKLPTPKVMSYQLADGKTEHFVRPVHGLVVLHGEKVVNVSSLGLKSGNKTLGHRFLSKGRVIIKRASDYEKTLEKQGKVIASFEKRRSAIVHGLDKVVAKLSKNAKWLGGEGELVDEVTSIVESPRVYVGAFDQAFLEIPRECLIVSMQQHQRYFPLAEGQDRLRPKFLFVANMHPTDASQIIRGNERVLRARLSDAKFFYEQDKKVPLGDRLDQLKQVVYHHKLGTQYERVVRIKELAKEIAALLKLGQKAAELTERAGWLCKSDLVTNMVGEFPELQGIMGRYYQLATDQSADSAAVAQAIEEHYHPRFAGDSLPQSAVGICLALADKLDTLVNIFGIGLAPTGEKDPFGLRRAAIGVIRILVEKSLALEVKELVEKARRPLISKHSVDTGTDLPPFILERLRSYLRERSYAADEIDSVLALNPTRFDHVIPRLEAIKKFRTLPEGLALAAANKRIQNILRQAGVDSPDMVDAKNMVAPAVDISLLREPAERELAHQLREITMRVRPLVSRGDYASALKELSRLCGVVDAFFDGVMVMVEDDNLRKARLSLLAMIRHEFRQIADLSRLQG